MNDKCPGCGSPFRTVEGKGTDYETIIYTCGTGEEAGFYGRDCWANQCMAKEDQIAQYAELLREAGEVVEWAANHRCLCTGDPPEMISSCSHKAKALAPKIRAALEEKP